MLLKVKNLSVEYDLGGRKGCAVKNVSFVVKEGQIVGLVGESGSGKSTLGWSIIKILSNNANISSGDIILKGQNLMSMDEKAMDEKIRGKEISVIVQDTQNALNPVFTIDTQINDILLRGADKSKVMNLSIFDLFRKVDVHKKHEAVKLLTKIGIADAEKRMDEYPHCFSGGMKQRVMMAMAFLVSPSLLIADEPTTALDVTVEAQILEQMRNLIQKYKTAVLYITHNLSLISSIADKVMIMYAGHIVEITENQEIFNNPLHPYTKALINCLPKITKPDEPLETIQGRVPSIFSSHPGCKFLSRCCFAKSICNDSPPALKKVKNSSHEVACFMVK